MKQHKSQGMALLSLIFSMIIVAILAVIVLRSYQGHKKTSGGVEVKNPIERTKAVRCLVQRRDIETALNMYRIENDSFPSSLSGLRGLSEQDTRCPETGALYSFDPVSGKVSCPDHP